MTPSPEQKYTWTSCPDKSLQVNSVAINDDGSRCVFGTSNEFSEGIFHTYCCDSDGTIKWKAPVSKEKTYQGVFWTAVSGDGNSVAVGGETSKTCGFLRAYDGQTGTEVLNQTPPDRVNQVSLSNDGQWLVACYGRTVEIYQFSSSKNKYLQVKKETNETHNINSCAISSNGDVVVASGIQYDDSGDTTVTKGKVYAYGISNGKVNSLGSCELPTGSMRTAIVDSGNFWAASLHDGSCVLIDKNEPTKCQWQYQPQNVKLSLAYAVDITETDAGEVFVACGANVHNADNQGLLYLVESVKQAGAFTPVEKWTAPIKRSVNPGVSLDRNALYVTATDGQPESNSTSETPGTFYLFGASSGEALWHYDTAIMNWPMMLASDGGSVFGGSDDGAVYYWKL